MKYETNRSRGKHHDVTLDIQGVEPWAVLCLLDMLREDAKEAGLSQTGPTHCVVYVSFEWNEETGDIDKFRRALSDKYVAYGASYDTGVH